MRLPSWLDRRVGYILGTLSIVLGVTAPAAFPVLASADTLTSRSITMSNSVADATGVTYELQATVPGGIDTTGGVIIEFCDNSPIPELTCNHPAGLSVASVAAGTGTGLTAGTASAYTTNGDTATMKWVPSNNVDPATTIKVDFKNIHNPTAEATFYARILSYKTAIGYTDAETIGTPTDKGGIALATVKNVQITAYVAESLSFCVTGLEDGDTTADKPGKNCATPIDPSMTLGESDGNGGFVLVPGTVSTGTDVAQLSTNASGGAIVNLHSDATSCGGLILKGEGTCDITAQNNTGGDVDGSAADFGITVGSAVDGSGDSSGSGTFAAVNNYNATKYYIDYADGNATGVTSTYGSPIFSSAGKPVNNMNIPFTFGVSATNSTPAGVYTANLNLIATGTF